MSNFCCINLKDSNFENDYDSFNDLANVLVRFALDNKIAVFFNSYDYGEALINAGNMREFFLISDSFLYKNCDSFLYKNCELLDNTQLLCQSEISQLVDFKSAFFEKYNFFEKIIEIIFRYDVFSIEIYITEDNTDNMDDFNTIISSKDGFMSDLYKSVVEAIPSYGGEFPTTKFVIHRSNNRKTYQMAD